MLLTAHAELLEDLYARYHVARTGPAPVGFRRFYDDQVTYGSSPTDLAATGGAKLGELLGRPGGYAAASKGKA